MQELSFMKKNNCKKLLKSFNWSPIRIEELTNEKQQLQTKLHEVEENLKRKIAAIEVQTREIEALKVMIKNNSIYIVNRMILLHVIKRLNNYLKRIRHWLSDSWSKNRRKLMQWIKLMIYTKLLWNRKKNFHNCKVNIREFLFQEMNNHQKVLNIDEINQN